MDSFKTWIEARKKYTGPSLFDEPAAPSPEPEPESPKGDWVPLWKTTDKGKGGPIPDAPKPTPQMSDRFKRFGPARVPDGIGGEKTAKGLPSVNGMQRTLVMKLLDKSKADPERFFVVGSYGRVIKVKGLHVMRDNGRVVGYDKRGHRLIVSKNGMASVVLYPDTIRPMDFMSS